MNNWKRITLVIFVLIGSVTFFRYWSISQFNQVFDNLSDLYVANSYLVYPSFKQNEQNAGLASTSPEISEEFATSTDSGLASTSPEISVIVATSTNPELSFTFPQKGDEVYISCTYPISWQSSTTINSLKTALVDAGTRESMGPITSGLAKENTIEIDLQNLKWKVGVVWPGEYFISISNVNGVATDERSQNFIINEIPNGSDEKERKNFCEETGGNL
jgi:hypothetical protein